MGDTSILLLLGLGLVLGLRHGMDWDHIAAITDIAGTQTSRMRGLTMGTLYALGHAFVVAILGLLALWVGAILPEWIDTYLEKVVGITLVLLGVWVFWSLLHNPSEFRLMSRWMLLFFGIGVAYRWVMGKLTGVPRVKPVAGGQSTYSYGPFTSYSIGMIHGIGAETGSQALFLASVAGATTTVAASFLLIAFVVGLVISNSVITVASILGFLGNQSRRKAYMVLGVIVGAFSLVVGIIFLLGKGPSLPSIIS